MVRRVDHTHTTPTTLVAEHVSAIGRSRLDRSIQYKYLNPNLVSVITESTDPIRRECHTPGVSCDLPPCCPSHLAAISIYLVDIVTGGVIFHTSHKAAVAPVHLVHSENWIVVSSVTLTPSPSFVPSSFPPHLQYQFLNSKLRRHELVVLELYEKDSNMTRSRANQSKLQCQLFRVGLCGHL